MTSPVQEKVDSFFASYPTITLPKAKVLIGPNTEINSIYYLRKGLIRQSVYTKDGQEISIIVFKTGAYFPILLSLAQKENVFSFEAHTQATLNVAPVGAVLSFIKNNPDVLFDLTTRFSQATYGLAQRICSLMDTNMVSKIATLLYYFSLKFGKEGETGTFIDFTCSHKELATWIGTTRETISRKISQLEKDGILSYNNKHFTVHNLETLRKLSSE